MNLLQWSYGVYAMTGEKGNMSLKKIISAPFLLAITIGFILYFGKIPLPSILYKCINTIGDLNTPLAMFSIGIYLAQVNFKSMLCHKKLYSIAVVRLLLIPFIITLLLLLVPSRFHDLKMAILIASACPTGSNVAVYAQLHNKDYAYAVETVIISTFLSLFSLPLLIQFVQYLGVSLTSYSR